MPTPLLDGQTFLFIGDSITDCGRRGVNKPLGDGYVKFFHDLLLIRDALQLIAGKLAATIDALGTFAFVLDRRGFLNPPLAPFGTLGMNHDVTLLKW